MLANLITLAEQVQFLLPQSVLQPHSFVVLSMLLVVFSLASSFVLRWMLPVVVLQAEL